MSRRSRRWDICPVREPVLQEGEGEFSVKIVDVNLAGSKSAQLLVCIYILHISVRHPGGLKLVSPEVPVGIGKLLPVALRLRGADTEESLSLFLVPGVLPALKRLICGQGGLRANQ